MIIPYGEAADVATMLEEKFTGHLVYAETETALVDFGRAYGVSVKRVRAGDASPAAAVLSPGMRICFTGTAILDGAVYEREEMEEITWAAGFHSVNNITKTRCDCLVAADVATMSSKAKNAMRWGKPVINAEDFLHFVNGR